MRIFADSEPYLSATRILNGHEWPNSQALYQYDSNKQSVAFVN